WQVRKRAGVAHDFWNDIAVLDLTNAESSARSLDERTFAIALKALMASDPEKATVAFRALHQRTDDPAVRTRSRIGLTMALSWQSDWPSLARIGADQDSIDQTDSLALQAGVERWGRALSDVPPPVID